MSHFWWHFMFPFFSKCFNPSFKLYFCSIMIPSIYLTLSYLVILYSNFSSKLMNMSPYSYLFPYDFSLYIYVRSIFVYCGISFLFMFPLILPDLHFWPLLHIMSQYLGRFLCIQHTYSGLVLPTHQFIHICPPLVPHLLELALL